jgi:hypothetical protein
MSGFDFEQDTLCIHRSGYTSDKWYPSSTGRPKLDEKLFTVIINSYLMALRFSCVKIRFLFIRVLSAIHGVHQGGENEVDLNLPGRKGLED